jgi:DNA mismatch repair protein MutS
MGANDSMLNHQSTFMVEMEEVAYILYHATKDSLILMDELGRGTSTSDGISIAHAVISHIHEHIQAKTICSTHYHELIALEQELTHAQNYHAEAKQTDDALELTFKMKKGGSSKSFGIEVAKRVGLPQSIIDNASSLLTEKYQDK